jgi:hypothetical protein
MLRVIGRPIRYPAGMGNRMLQVGDTFEARTRFDERVLLYARRAERVAQPAMIVGKAGPEVFHPLDHDKDGHKGGSLPSAQRGKVELYSQLDAMGIGYDRRWGAARLQALIDAAQE